MVQNSMHVCVEIPSTDKYSVLFHRNWNKFFEISFVGLKKNIMLYIYNSSAYIENEHSKVLFTKLSEKNNYKVSF